MTGKRFTITQDFEEHHRQIRDNGHIIMGCFVEPQAEVIVDLLNELHEENQIKLEMVDAFIRGMEDEKGIVPEDREFQCRMNHTIKVLKELKKDMLNPTEFKRLKELRMADIIVGDDLVKLMICMCLQSRGLTDEEKEFLEELEHQYFYKELEE